MPIKVTIPESLVQLPNRIDRAIGIAREGSALLIEREIKVRYRRDDAVASGATVRSVRRLLFRRDRVRIGADTLQAQFIEGGRQGGPVPPWRIFKPILRKWSRDKGLNFSDSALWFIARKIRRRGFQARRSVEFAARLVAPKVARVFRGAFARL